MLKPLIQLVAVLRIVVRQRPHLAQIQMRHDVLNDVPDYIRVIVPKVSQADCVLPLIDLFYLR